MVSWDFTGHRKMLMVGTAGAMMTTYESSVLMWSCEGRISLLSSVKPIGNEKKFDRLHIMVLLIT